MDRHSACLLQNGDANKTADGQGREDRDFVSLVVLALSS